MSETKFTPGPWRVLPLDGKYYGTLVRIGEHSITVWTSDHCNPSVRELADGPLPDDGMVHVEDETSYANASLIAAAPDLYEACERASIALDDWLNTYASELCDEQRVKEAVARIGEFGTIGYIGEVRQQLRVVLARARGEKA